MENLEEIQPESRLGRKLKYSFLNGLSHDSKTYNAWRQIKVRCFDKNRSDYADYGGRGITMCDEWVKDLTDAGLTVSVIA